MNFQSGRKKRRMQAEINVTSFVDIIFNLLVFFILSTSFSQGNTQGSLSVDLPAASTRDATTTSADMIVAVTREGTIVVDGQSLRIDEVGSAAQKWAEANTGSVIVQADTEVAQGKVVAVMDEIKKAGIKSLAIAAQGD